MLLSIIIPVYNCENLIERCIESIEKQNFQDYEIILVNDGSQDHSLAVCQVLEKKYKNICVLSQNNKGTSTARNHGLTCATGEYVWFVDSDDYIPDGFLPRLAKIIESRSFNVVAFNYQYITHAENSYKELYKQEKDVDIVSFLNDAPCMFAATKVYKKTSLQDVKFLDGIKNIEDFLFNIQYLSRQETIHTFPVSGYVYDHTNENSTSLNRSKRNLIKASQDSVRVHYTILKEIERIDNKEMKEVVYEQLNYSVAGHLYSLLRFYNIGRLKQTIKIYKKWGLYPIKNVRKRRAKHFVCLANYYYPFIIFSCLYRFALKLMRLFNNHSI